MPRGRRYIVPGCVYHVTHRCHNRAFLLWFKKDRTAYRKLLRLRLQEANVALLSYCITCNHVHLLVRPDPAAPLESLSRLMQRLEGDFSQLFNRRKARRNAFWGDRYHATMVDTGPYLWKCLLYIDLNMVRAGVVPHPREWEWTAYPELMGLRQRYRLLDMPMLLDLLGSPTLEAFRENYEYGVNEALAENNLQRDGKWTDCLAVGDEIFARDVGRRIPRRMAVEVAEDDRDASVWVVRESAGSDRYNVFSGSKASAKEPN